jgi:hypothetical protein
VEPTAGVELAALRGARGPIAPLPAGELRLVGEFEPGSLLVLVLDVSCSAVAAGTEGDVIGGVFIIQIFMPSTIQDCVLIDVNAVNHCYLYGCEAIRLSAKLHRSG